MDPFCSLSLPARQCAAQLGNDPLCVNGLPVFRYELFSGFCRRCDAEEKEGRTDRRDWLQFGSPDYPVDGRLSRLCQIALSLRNSERGQLFRDRLPARRDSPREIIQGRKKRAIEPPPFQAADRLAKKTLFHYIL